MKQIPATFQAKMFTCLHCGITAKQRWGFPSRQVEGLNNGSDKSFAIAMCDSCSDYSVWMNEKLAYPLVTTAPEPNEDLPNDIKVDFNEAREIVQFSPRGASALLRLCIQKICKHLGEAGNNINADISSLVEKGLPEKIQQALDIVRVVGNNAVHPGQIDLQDDKETANKMFSLVNLVAEVMISQPKHVQQMYQDIVPDNLKSAISKRDGT